MFNVTSVCMAPPAKGITSSFKGVRFKYQILCTLYPPRGATFVCLSVRVSLCMYLYRYIHYHSVKCIVMWYCTTFWLSVVFMKTISSIEILCFYLGSGCVCLFWLWIALGTVQRLLMGFLMATVMRKFPGCCSAPWEMYWQRRYSTPVWIVYTCATLSLPLIGVFCTHVLIKLSFLYS